MGKSIVIDQLKVRSREIKEADENYIKGKKWRCRKSPTGAHYWTDEIKWGFLVCKFCGREQEVIVQDEVNEWVKL